MKNLGSGSLKLLIEAPKGRKMIAQGSALGERQGRGQSPERATQGRGSRGPRCGFVSPFQGSRISGDTVPRAPLRFALGCHNPAFQA